jgi:hypothetical protein
LLMLSPNVFLLYTYCGDLDSLLASYLLPTGIFRNLAAYPLRQKWRIRS